MNGWQKVALREIAEFANGVNFTKDSFGSGLPIVGVRDFGDRLIPDWSQVEEIDGNAVTSDRQLLADGDLLFVRSNGNRDLVGRSLFIERPPRSSHSAFTIRARLDDTRVIPRFLAYQMRHAHRTGLMAAANGTNITNLNQGILGSIPVLLPGIEEQQRVVDILGAMDDLILANRRRIELLDQMAQAIYREWFVHFRYPRHENDRLVLSDLGSIPEGWAVRQLRELADVNRSQRKPTDEEQVVYIDISCLSDRWINVPNSIPGDDAPGRARRIISAGDVLYSMVRPGRRAHCLVIAPGADWIASTGLAVISATKAPSSWLFEAVSRQEFSDYLVTREGGSAYPAVKADDFASALLAVAPVDVLAQFDSIVGPMHRCAWELRHQAQAIASIRDLLLPKLVTGQIDASSLDQKSLAQGAVG